MPGFPSPHRREGLTTCSQCDSSATTNHPSQLRETVLEDPETVSHQAFALVEKLLDAFIIHGDLSEYNLVYHDDRLFAIDFQQSIDLSSRVDRHIKFGESKGLLLRDLMNLEKYFRRYGVELDADGEHARLSNRFEEAFC